MGIIRGGNVIPGAVGRADDAFIYEYDFAIDGGAVGTIPLRPVGSAPSPLPSGFVAINSIIEIITPLTSGGAATAGLQVEAAGDIVAAAVVSGAPWSTGGRKAGIVQSTATSIKTTTATRVPSLVVAVAALTAGKFYLRLAGYDVTRA